MVDYPEYKFHLENYEVSSLYENLTSSRGEGWDNLGKKVKLKSLNFESLVLKYNLQTIDFLFCDIEGEDEKVLNNLDLSKYNFKIVMWEQNNTESTSLLKQKFNNLGFKTEPIHNNVVAYKPEYINNENCLKNAVNVFKDADWSIIADNISSKTDDMIQKYKSRNHINYVSIGDGAGTFNLALDKALQYKDDEIIYFMNILS